MRRDARWVSLGCAAFAACAEPYSNEDLLFVQAVPDETQVMIDLPSTPTSGDEQARYHQTMRDTSEDINEAIFGPLATVQAIAAGTPTYRDVDARAWGPIQTSTRVAYSLYMARTATAGIRVPTSTGTIVPIEARIDFVLFGQITGADRDVPVLSGGFAATEPDGGGIGFIRVDLDALTFVDPQMARSGTYLGAYDTRDTGLTLAFVLEAANGDVAYYQFERRGGVTDFRSHQRTDVFGEPTGTSARESVLLFGRWLADDRGRGDLRYEGGDLPTSVSGAECWDGSLRRVYFNASTTELGAPEGSVEACAPGLREPLYLAPR